MKAAFFCPQVHPPSKIKLNKTFKTLTKVASAKVVFDSVRLTQIQRKSGYKQARVWLTGLRGTGYPADVQADIWADFRGKFLPIAQSAGRSSWQGFYADVHDQRGSQNNFSQEQVGLMFRSLFGGELIREPPKGVGKEDVGNLSMDLVSVQVWQPSLNPWSTLSKPDFVHGHGPDGWIPLELLGLHFPT